MDCNFRLTSKAKPQNTSVKGMFDGETETTAERLQRQQIVNDLNYGFESAIAEKDSAVEELGDMCDFDKYLEEKEEKKKMEELDPDGNKKKTSQRQSKYIGILMQRANERKREMDIIYEKTLLKDREKDDAMFEGKEKFVTAAYKRKLEADRQWVDDVRKKEEMTKVKNKSSFMTHIMDSRANDMEMGTKVEPKNEEKTVQNKEEEEDDEFDGFIMAPDDHQIKGNVKTDDSDDVGLIVVPRNEREVSNRSRSRSRNRHRHHSHHLHHRR